MNTLVVSAYYKIPSKASHDVYREYLMRFFRAIRCPLLFFTSADLVEELRAMAPPSCALQFRIVGPSDWKAWSVRGGRGFWDRQTARDPEAYHTPELAALWYEKKEFVKRAMEMPELAVYDVFVWCDAGCVRDDASEEALRSFGLRNAPLHDDRLHLQQIESPKPKAFYAFPDKRIAGAIFAGNRTAWTSYSPFYDVVLQQYDEAGVCANSDQYVIARCVDLEPERFALWPVSSALDRWFFFLAVL